MSSYAFSVRVNESTKVLGRLTQVLAEHQGEVRYVEVLHHPTETEVFIECDVAGAIEPIVETLRLVEGVATVSDAPPMSQMYGKRIIIMGGGAQVGQVALGAITEADRHNI